MITKEEWERTKGSKYASDTIIRRETEEYLRNGGIIRRREKGGEITKLGSLDGKSLHVVKEVKTKED